MLNDFRTHLVNLVQNYVATNVLKRPPLPAGLIEDSQKYFDEGLEKLNARIEGKKSLVDSGVSIADIFLLETLLNAFTILKIDAGAKYPHIHHYVRAVVEAVPVLAPHKDEVEAIVAKAFAPK